jgi:tRNA(Arg) A34 adenosine deaminase TadA
VNRKIFSYFEIAARTATSQENNRHFLLGAIAIRKDGTMVRALNSPTEDPKREVHAEFKLCRKIDSGATVYVARVRIMDGAFAMAKPCPSCMKLLISKRVSRIYFTTGNNEFDSIKF